MDITGAWITGVGGTGERGSGVKVLGETGDSGTGVTGAGDNEDGVTEPAKRMVDVTGKGVTAVEADGESVGEHIEE